MNATITVHLRVVEAETKQPTPVRVSIGDATGNRWVPCGRFVDFPTGKGECVGGQLLRGTERYFYLDGSCEIALPTGVELQISISKGPGYRAIQEKVVLGLGQLTLRFEIAAIEKFPRSEWLNGDARVHLIDPLSAFLEAAAEGVDVTQLLATVTDTPSQDGHMYRSAPYLTSFSGTKPCLETDQGALAVNTLNTHPILGNVGLLNSHRPIFPLSYGDMDETDDWSICDWCDQCHRKTGLVTWVDAFRADRGFVSGEALLAAILGKIDAFEISPTDRLQTLLGWYYALLNAGVRLPLVGSSGKESNKIAIGAMRTWVPRSDGLLHSDWIAAVRRGATVISTTLPCTFTANGQPPGSVLQLEESHQPIQIRSAGYAHSPRQHELIVNGKILRDLDPRMAEIALPSGGWLAVRFLDLKEVIHTSPIYVEVANRPRFCDVESIGNLRRLIESTVEWINTVGRFAKAKSKEHLLELASSAEEILQQRLESAGG